MKRLLVIAAVFCFLATFATSAECKKNNPSERDPVVIKNKLRGFLSTIETETLMIDVMLFNLDSTVNGYRDGSKKARDVKKALNELELIAFAALERFDFLAKNPPQSLPLIRQIACILAARDCYAYHYVSLLLIIDTTNALIGERPANLKIQIAGLKALEYLKKSMTASLGSLKSAVQKQKK